jgi:beta-glucanase (GH16 family)
VLVVVVAVAAVLLSTGAFPTDEQHDPGWKLVWHDEFSSRTLAPRKWLIEDRSTFGEGNGELACLMDRPDNVALRDGVLTLRAQHESVPLPCGSQDARFPQGREYSSAMISTKGKAAWTYGRFEVRARLPTQRATSKGLWPAFWLRPTDGGAGELDALEAIGGDASSSEWNQVHHTIWFDYASSFPQESTSVEFPSGSPSDGFHTYVVKWQRGSIRWYVDRRLTYARSRVSTPWLDDAFNRPFFLRLNLAVGGSWPGEPDAATAFPADYAIDYVRVYQWR